MNPVQELRCRDRRDRDGLFAQLAKLGAEIQLATLGGDEHARVDQRPHRLLGTLG